MSDSESENYNALDFEKKFFTTQILCWNRMLQILNLRYFGMSDFIKVCIQKITLPSFTPRTRDFLLFPAFLKLMITEKIFTTHQILGWKEYIASDFETQKSTHQILT